MRELPLPAQFDPSRVGAVWRVPYEDRAREAPAWAESHGLGPAAGDWFRLCLLAVNVDYAQRHVAHYTRRPAEGGKYDLTVWPYHAMLGGIGHALAPAVEEAFFFHGVAWHSQPEFQVKAENRSPSTIRCSGRRSPTAPTAIAFAEGTPS